MSVGEGAPSGLQPPPSSAAARSHPTDGVHGTAFHPLPTEEEEGFELVTRLAALFEQHTPASVRRDFADPTRANYAHAPPPEGLAVPGPRWKGPAPLAPSCNRPASSHAGERRPRPRAAAGSHGRISTSSSSRCAARAAAWT